jgi:hypothetical protein
MNKARRKKIETIIERLADLRADLDNIQDEENMSFESLPENMQQGERGQAMEDKVATINEAMDELDSAVEKLNEVIQ